MAFPTVAAADTKSGTQASNATGWTLTYPTNIAANDLLLAFIGSDGSATGTFPSGWVTTASGANDSLILGKKKATGSETGNFTVTLSASEQGCWRVIRIAESGWQGTLGANFGAGVEALIFTTTASNSPNPPSLDPADWTTEDTLWIAVASCDGAVTFTGFPSGFTQEDHSTAGGHAASSGGSTGAGLAVCYRKEAVSSKDPAAFTLSASEDWHTGTIAVRGTASAPTGTLAASTAGNYS